MPGLTFKIESDIPDPVAVAIHSPFDYHARPIWEEIEEISDSVPDEVWFAPSRIK